MTPARTQAVGRPFRGPAVRFRRIASLLLIAMGAVRCDRQPEEPGPPPVQSRPAPQDNPRIQQVGSANASESRGKYGAFQTVFTDVAGKVIPSVVSISMEKTVTAPQNPFEFFFEQDPFGSGNGPRQPRQRKESGLGSGFITDKEGYILTNNHVIEGAQKIMVQLFDERELEAELVGADKPSDLAVIKIKGDVPDDLAPLPFGDSEKLQIGEWVVAVGAPFGLYETVTTGIISAMGRQNTGISTYGNFLQTDAAINPGNSGGPLVNLDGQVVGINTAIFSQSGGYMGIGFAIPVNLARNVMESLRKNGRVTRGWLGVSIQPISRDMAEALGLKQGENGSAVRGALVGDVVPRSPAEKAGLKRGDVILRLQGQEVKDANDLMNRIALVPPGTTVELRVFRDGREFNQKIKIEKREEERLARTPGPAAEDDVTVLGLDATDLTEDVRRQFGIEGGIESGAVVVRVDPNGAAAAAGIQEGDLIQEANRRKIGSARDLRDAVAKTGKGKNILFLVYRKGSTFFAMVTRN